MSAPGGNRRGELLERAVRRLVDYAGGLQAFATGLGEAAGGLDLVSREGVRLAELAGYHLRAEHVELQLRVNASGWVHLVRYTRGAGTIMQPMDCQRLRVRDPLYVLEGEVLRAEGRP